MEIADAVSCDFYDARGWEGCERSRFRLSKQGEQVGLEIETERIGNDRETEELTSLNLARMDCETLRRIQSCLGEWLQQTSPEQTELRTRPVEGMYRDTSTEVEVYHLQIEVTSRGLRILALGSGNQPVPNAVHIPATNEIHNDSVDRHNHLKRLYSLIEIFLTGIDPEAEDVIQSTKYLLNPEAHIHPSLASVCLGRLDNGDFTGVIQAAGTALEEALQSHVPGELASRGNSASDLANQAFRESDPVFQWGFNGGEQKGLQFLYSGAFMALRNPASHRRADPDRNRYLDDIDERDALDILCLFNFLLRRLDTYGETELEREDS